MSAPSPPLALWVKDFSPGFLDTPEEDRLPGGASPDARNGDLTRIEYGVNGRPKRATLRKRKGTRLLNPVAMDAGAKVDGLFDFRRTGLNAQLLAVCNGKAKVFDGVDTFAPIGATAPFWPGFSARACFFKNNAFLFDGWAFLRYNGAALLPIGGPKPTGITNMIAVAPTGTGVTGTYESYYVWYDQVMDHESSPTDVTAQLVLVNQAREHTKPTGVPSAAVTHWRAYTRRVDTNEFNFYRSATVPIGTAIVDENVSDTARRDAGAGPFSSDNDEPPGAFAILVAWKGYGIGVLKDDDSYYVSKLGDLESWHPKNKFPVGRGDGEALTSVIPYGSDLLVTKGHQSYRLVGDALPFSLDPLHSRYGNVSQEAAIEVKGALFAWDREKGPYRTNTVNWEPLADGQIQGVLRTLNRTALGDIRATYSDVTDIIRWAVPVLGSIRKRLVLKYHVGLSTWLPPDTGLEYASFTTFTSGTGLGTYVGDEWGRVYELDSGDRDGVPAGVSTLVGAVLAGSATTVQVDAPAVLYTTGSGLAGLPVAVLSPAGDWQWRRVLSNTADTITLDTVNDTAWTTIPAAGWVVMVGGIQWYHWTPWLDFDRPEEEKSLHSLFVQGKMTSATHDLSVHLRFNDDAGVAEAKDYVFPTGTLSGVWGVMIWGTSLWGTTTRRLRKQRIGRSAFSLQILFSNFYPDQPIDLTAFGVTADPLPGRKVTGVGV